MQAVIRLLAARKYRLQYDVNNRKSHDKNLRPMSARGFSIDQTCRTIDQPIPDFY
jgi:hypothetical protein